MINSHKIAARSTKLLNEHKAYKAPVDVFSLIEKMGIKILVEPMEDEMSGFIKIDENETVIVINANHHKNRQRFTAAHEIGHYCLHRHENGEEQVFVDHSFSKGIVDSRKGSSRKVFHRSEESSHGTDFREVEANRFAASLLMPEKLIEDLVERWEIDMSNDYDIQRLASKFGVSQQAMTLRLASLGVNYM